MTKQVNMNVVMESPEIDLTIWGYIPGSHLFYCGDCCRSPHYDQGNWPHKGDSRSTRCITHALDARLKDLRELEGELIVELGRNPIEAAIHAHETYMGGMLRAVVLSAIASLVFICLLVAWLNMP